MQIIVLFPRILELYVGVGDRVSRVIVYQKSTGNDYLSSKSYEDYIFRGKAKLIISLFSSDSYVHCIYLCILKVNFDVCFWKNNSQHKLEKQTWEGTAAAAQQATFSRIFIFFSLSRVSKMKSASMRRTKVFQVFIIYLKHLWHFFFENFYFQNSTFE